MLSVIHICIFISVFYVISMVISVKRMLNIISGIRWYIISRRCC